MPWCVSPRTSLGLTHYHSDVQSVLTLSPDYIHFGSGNIMKSGGKLFMAD